MVTILSDANVENGCFGSFQGQCDICREWGGNQRTRSTQTQMLLDVLPNPLWVENALNTVLLCTSYLPSRPRGRPRALLAAAVQGPQAASQFMSPTWEKIKIQNLKSCSYWKRITFATSWSQNIVKLNHPKSETVHRQYLHRTEGRHPVKIILLEFPNTGKKEMLILTETPNG